MEYRSDLGSLQNFETASLQDVKSFSFSNCFDVARKSGLYERVVVAAIQHCALEVLRVEGRSTWYICSHDEFVLCMDEEVEIHLMRLDGTQRAPDRTKKGAVHLSEAPLGPKMGWMRLARGQQALLPAKVAYQFRAARPGVVVLLTCKKESSVEE